MIVTLSGVTGIGKSFFKNQIIKELGFKNLVIRTTRKKRENEVNNIDKLFLSDEEFEKLKKKGKLSVDFEFLGNKYAYDTDSIHSNENQVTEVHYSTIYNFKENAKDVFAIYMIPKDLEKAKEELRKRKLSPEVEKNRLKEIDEHVKEFSENKNLQKQFDYIFVNNFDEKSKEELLSVIKEKINQRKKEK